MSDTTVRTTAICRCGHDVSSHYFGSECQMICSCRQFGYPLNRSEADRGSEGYYVHLADVHAGLSLWHCLRCFSVVEKTARAMHDGWHDQETR